jgi:hypothetical protein
MEIELKEIIFGIEIVENLFEVIENEMIMDSFLRSVEKPKIEDVVPFRGGLPQMPLIVGLAGVLPDGINNLISKFVGYQSKPAKQLTGIIEEIKGEIGECREGSDIPRICVRVHINQISCDARKRYGSIYSCFINQLKEKNITKEKLDILKLRLLRFDERRQNFIRELCNQKQRKMLNI